MVAHPALEFVSFSPPPSIELTPEEAELFKIEDKNPVGTDRHRVVRMGDALIGFHYNPFGTPPPQYAMLKHVAEVYVIVRHGGQTRRLPLVANHDFRTLVPSPSGRRFLVFNSKGPLPDGKVVVGGHVLEAELDSLETSVALTGTTGRGDRAAAAGATTVTNVDYVDDDTLIASTSRNDIESLVLLERDPATKAFVEVSRRDAPPDITGLCAAGTMIATRASTKVTVFTVVDHRLVELGSVDTPAPYGSVLAHPEDTRKELVFFDKTSYYRLVRHA